MVLMNAGKRARYTDSITNLPQGGGPNKAGLPSSVGKDHWFSIALAVSGTSNTLYGVPRGLRYTVNPNVRQSRPVGVRPDVGIYFTVPGTQWSVAPGPL
jgi:hypothetical protein